MTILLIAAVTVVAFLAGSAWQANRRRGTRAMAARQRAAWARTRAEQTRTRAAVRREVAWQHQAAESDQLAYELAGDCELLATGGDQLMTLQREMHQWQRRQQ